MATINIDGTEYDTENISENAKAQISNIQIVDQKIILKQQEITIMQAARNSFAQALKDDLEKGE